MADKRLKAGVFNSSFFLPILDLVVFTALFVGAGTYWYQNRGLEEIAEAEEQVRAAEAENREQIAGMHQQIEDAFLAQEQTIQDKDAKIKQAEMVDAQIQVEHQRIRDAEVRTEELTDAFLDLRSEIERTDDRRRSKQAEILERREEIRELDESIATLGSQVADSLARRNGIQADIAALHRERQRDPLSIFPPGAGLAATVEIDNDDRVFAVSLSGVIKEFGSINVGLTGNVGLFSEAQSSVKEGGAFANIPVAFRRASLDLSGGVASVRDPSGDDNLKPFLGATMRYAPLRKERFFLLAGSKLRETELSLQLGIGFGRR